jgi:hypothetical protein
MVGRVLSQTVNKPNTNSIASRVTSHDSDDSCIRHSMDEISFANILMEHTTNSKHNHDDQDGTEVVEDSA